MPSPPEGTTFYTVKFIYSLLLLLLLTGVSFGQVTNKVTVAWDLNPEADVTGYNTYYGVVGLGVTNKLSIPAPPQSITNLVWGSTYWFYVTATNTSGLESDPSTVLTHTFPSFPAPPVAVTINIQLLSANQAEGPFESIESFQYEPEQFFAVKLAIKNTTNPPVPPGADQ